MFLIFIFIASRKYFFKSRNSRIARSKIDKIKISKIENVYAPEVEVYYEFYYASEKFNGSAYVAMQYFLDDIEFFLSQKNELPVLTVADCVLTGEEHIETHLLKKKNTIRVEFNRANPGESRIYVKRNAKNLFQNIDVKFPWQL